MSDIQLSTNPPDDKQRTLEEESTERPDETTEKQDKQYDMQNDDKDDSRIDDNGEDNQETRVQNINMTKENTNKDNSDTNEETTILAEGNVMNKDYKRKSADSKDAEENIIKQWKTQKDNTVEGEAETTIDQQNSLGEGSRHGGDEGSTIGGDEDETDALHQSKQHDGDKTSNEQGRAEDASIKDRVNKQERLVDESKESEDEEERTVNDDQTSEVDRQSKDGGESDDTRNGRQESDVEDQNQNKEKVRKVIGLTSDGEEIYQTLTEDDETDDYSDLDDAERERQRIGKKKRALFTPAGPLTTVLVTRQDEERKRNKLIPKSKKQKMRGLAKQKSKKYGTAQDHVEEAETFSSGEEKVRQHGVKEPPFMEQYRYKKRVETKLDEEHYWSDSTADKDPLRKYEDMDSSFSSRVSSVTTDASDNDSSFDEHSGLSDGVHKLDKFIKRKGEVGDHDITENLKKTKDRKKGAMGSGDGRDDSTPKLTTGKYDIDSVDASSSYKDSGLMLTTQNGNELIDTSKVVKDQNANLSREVKYIDIHRKHKAKTENKHDKSGTHVIHVKEREEQNQLGRAEVKTCKKGPDIKSESKSTNFRTTRHSSSDSDYDRNSDIDSGVEDEEILDVVLTDDQQQMIVNVLFDSDMQLRQEFCRDGNGRIVRRFDNSVIYDPSTGRFTFRRRLGRVFNIPRLKRNKKGRPTGGFIEDEYGPTSFERQKSGMSRSSRRELESRMSLSDSPLYGRRSRGDGRFVGFSVPDDDMESVLAADLEFQKRGRRDISSGIRRKLRSRLFRKKRKVPEASSHDQLPDIQRKKAWTSDSMTSNRDDSSHTNGQLSTIIYRGGRSRYSTPGSQRKAGIDPQQWQKYREGLESDKKILASLQDRTPADSKGAEQYTNENATENSSDPIANGMSEHEYMNSDLRPGISRGPTYWSEDGRFVVREKGCPEIQPTPLFTIVRRPEENDGEQQIAGNVYTRHRNAPKSAPVPIQNNYGYMSQTRQGRNEGSIDSLAKTSAGDSQLTTIDDCRLRQLLEELYKDKKYFDHYVENTEPKSENVIHTKGLAEHGRDYLLEMADYWEKRGPLPPRPPQTEIGWKMLRQEQQMESSRISEHASTITVTPELRPYTVPGYIESPRKDDNRNYNNYDQNINESIV